MQKFIGCFALSLITLAGLLPGNLWPAVIEHDYDAMNRRILTRYEDGTVVERAYDPGGNLIRLDKQAGSPAAYFEDFEGALGSEWTTYSSSTACGRNEPSEYVANGGDFSWRMDVTLSGTYNLNELVLHLQVIGATWLRLEFATREYNDEMHSLPTSFSGHANGDGIAVSSDGANWHRLWQYPSSLNAWTVPTAIEMGSLIPLNGDVYIKFQQYDNYTVSTDGIFWDDIQLTCDGIIGLPQPPMKATVPVPADNADGLPLDTYLNWSDGGGATAYDVYFGTVATPGSAQFKGRQAGTGFDPGLLSPDMAYTWRIDAVNDSGTATGDLWHFRTQGLFPGHGEYCLYYGPCAEGLGGCENDSQCLSGLLCAQDAGAAYGYPADVDVCQMPPTETAYKENFEGPLGAEWSTYSSSSAYGRNEASEYSVNGGSASWRMDVTRNGTYNLNELVLHLRLNGATWLRLEFATREYNDEMHSLPTSFSGHANGDGIAVSSDGGNWHRLWQYPTSLNAWTVPTAIEVGSFIPLSGDVYIKFQQYDNYTAPTDGIFWDDIQLTCDGSISLP